MSTAAEIGEAIEKFDVKEQVRLQQVLPRARLIHNSQGGISRLVALKTVA